MLLHITIARNTTMAHIIPVCAQIALLLLIKIVQTHSEYPKSHHLLRGVESCDLFIFHVNISSKVFNFEDLLPSKIVSESAHPSRRKDGQSVFSTRFPNCQLRIFFPDFFFKTPVRAYAILEHWMIEGDAYDIYFKDTDPWKHTIYRNLNTYFLILSPVPKPGVGSITNPHRIYPSHHVPGGNLIFVFSAIGSLEICVVMQGYLPVVKHMKCQPKAESLLPQVHDLRTLPKYWDLPKVGFSFRDQSGPISLEYNPFNRSDPGSILFHLAQELLAKENATWKQRPTGLAYSGHPSYTKRTAWHTYNSRTKDMTYEGPEGYQFTTCHEETALSFVFYVKPFQPELWLGFGISLFVVIGSLTLYIKLGKRTSSFSPWMLIIASVVEETPSIPRHIKNQTFFRVIFGTWTLMAIVLTNGYISLMITDVNAPLKGSHPEVWEDLMCIPRIKRDLLNTNLSQEGLTTWDDLIRWRKYVKNVSDQEAVQFWEKYFTYRNTEPSGYNVPKKQNSSHHCFSLLSHVEKLSYHPLDYEFFDYLRDQAKRPYDSISNAPAISGKEYLLLLDLASPTHAYGPVKKNVYRIQTTPQVADAAVKEEVGNCEKTVLVTKSSMVSEEVRHYSKAFPTKKFFKGKDMIGVFRSGLSFRNLGLSRVMEYYCRLMNTGIYQRLMQESAGKLIHNRHFENRDIPTKSEVGMTMSGGISTLFFMSGFVLGLALLCYVFESRANLIQMTRRCKARVRKRRRRNHEIN